MKFNSIVAFGDSWIYGDELLDPVLAAKEFDAHCSWAQNSDYRESHCFVGLLGRHYGVPVENFGIPGGSLQSTIWTFLWWLQNREQHQDSLVLIGLTDSDRFSHYNPEHRRVLNDPPWNKFVHSTWVENDNGPAPGHFRTMCKQQMAYSVCPELSHYNHLQAALLFDGVSARNSIPLLQFHVAQPQSIPPVPTPTLIWPDQNFCRYFLNRPDNQDRRYYKSGGHPNEKGHEIIRDRLIAEIDCVILGE